MKHHAEQFSLLPVDPTYKADIRTGSDYQHAAQAELTRRINAPLTGRPVLTQRDLLPTKGQTNLFG